MNKMSKLTPIFHVLPQTAVRQLRALSFCLLALTARQDRLPAQTFVRSTADLPHHFPLDFVVDDVNRDGSLDLVFGYLNNPILTVLTNNGNGTFSVASTNDFPTIFTLFSADVNADGRLDVIGASYLTNTITILTNAGDGSFKFSSTTKVGRSPQGIAALDLNGDAKLDLVVTSRDQHILTMLTNSGAGTFDIAGTLPVATGPSGVTTADLNADGRTDLITANAEGDNLTVLTSAGSGNFSRFDLKVGDFPHRVLAEDINGDGSLDLISANTGDGTLTVLTNNGSGNFNRSATLRVGPGPFGIVAADLNRDGWIDLVSADSGEESGRTVTVLTNNGGGTFTRLATIQVSRAPFFLTAADVNGDGRLDLVTFGDSAHTLDILLNSPDPPSLRIQSSAATALQLSWSAAWPGFELEKNSTLLGGWQKVTNSALPQAGTNRVLVSPLSGHEFYRLIHP